MGREKIIKDLSEDFAYIYITVRISLGFFFFCLLLLQGPNKKSSLIVGEAVHDYAQTKSCLLDIAGGQRHCWASHKRLSPCCSEHRRLIMIWCWFEFISETRCSQQRLVKLSQPAGAPGEGAELHRAAAAHFP